MSRKCTLTGTFEGPNRLGDIEVYLTCPKRGNFKVCISPDSSCITLPSDEKPAPTPADPPPVRSSEPDETWSIRELRDHCEGNGIPFHHLNRQPKLLELIKAAQSRNFQDAREATPA